MTSGYLREKFDAQRAAEEAASALEAAKTGAVVPKPSPRSEAEAAKPVPSGTVQVVRDDALGADCLDVSGKDASWYAQFPDAGATLGTPLRYLVLYLHSCSRFLSVSADVVSECGLARTIVATNRQSSVRVRGDTITVPLSLRANAWNVVVLDLAYLLAEAGRMDPLRNPAMAAAVATRNLSGPEAAASAAAALGDDTAAGAGKSGGSKRASAEPPRPPSIPPSSLPTLRYARTERVRLHSGARVVRAYFASALRPHSELPPSARLPTLSGAGDAGNGGAGAGGRRGSLGPQRAGA